MRRLLLLALLLIAAPVPAPASAAPRAAFGWPLAGTPVVDRGFSPPRTTYAPGHRGVDLRASAGDPVLAAGPGEVTFAGVLAGRGVVTVTHGGGLRTTYEPVTATVRRGQAVARGAVLGRLSNGHASCRTGVACLHWGLLRGDTYLDPLALVLTQQVRLLPVGGAVGPAGALHRAPGGAPSLRPVAAGGGEGWTGPARTAGGLAATGTLVAGVGLLARRRAA